MLFAGAGAGVGPRGAVGRGVGTVVPLHALAQTACVCVPLASTKQSPVIALQLYIVVGGGVGMMQLAMQVDFVVKAPPALGAHV